MSSSGGGISRGALGRIEPTTAGATNADSYLKKRRRSLAHGGVCSDHGRPRPSPAGWIPGSPPPSYLCHLHPIFTFLIPRFKYLFSKNLLHLKLLRGNDRWAIGRHTWACLDEVRSPGASGMTRLVGSPRPRPGFAVIRAHTPVGERATPFFEIAVMQHPQKRHVCLHHCIKGESNPRRVDGNDPGYHYPINAYVATRQAHVCRLRTHKYGQTSTWSVRIRASI